MTRCPVRITAVGVVVPAHDEQDRVAACLRSVVTALRVATSRAGAAAPATRVRLVADRCHDRTEAVARSVVGPDGVLRHEGRGGVGAVRAAGVEQVLADLSGHDPAEILLLGTDADTRVPPDWVTRHLAYVEAGAPAVAGLALLDPTGTPAAVLRRHARLVAAGVHGPRHEHVYGANLAVRADAYRAVGGFDRDRHAEDHDLCERLEAAGHEVLRTVASTVLTSARLRGRAEHGLASLLARLAEPDDAGLGPAAVPAHPRPGAVTVSSSRERG